MRSRGREYARAVGRAVLQALVTTVFTAAEELPAPTRRLLRVGWTLAVVAAGAVSFRNAPAVEERPEPPAARPAVPRDGTAAAAVLVPVLTVGPAVVRRRLEQRWLDGLTRGGHPHPHRAVALRVGLVSLVGSLVSELLKTRQSRRPR